MKRFTYLSTLSILIFSFLSFLTPASTAQAASFIRVTTSGATSGSCGDSWANACNLLYALNSVATSGDEIWVAAGVYKPTTSTTDMTAYIPTKAGVAIYGGFDTSDTARSDRDPDTNLTIFSGDIDGNDSQSPIATDANTLTGYDTNSYHVVAGSASNVTLDGVTITGGYGPYGCAYGWYAQYGGGLYTQGTMTLNDVVFSGNRAFYGGGLDNTAVVTLTNVTFTGNYATGSGGGMFNEGGASTLTNITFTNNRATYDGAGMKSGGGPALTNVTFTDNYAGTNGGGFYINGSATLNNVTFTNNQGGNLGSAMTIEGTNLVTLDNISFINNSGANSGGALGAWSGYAVLNNVTFSDNSSDGWGGAIAVNTGGNWTLNNVLITGNTTGSNGAGISTSSPMTLTNVTLVNNSTTADWSYGGGLFQTSAMVVRNSLIWGNTVVGYTDQNNICTSGCSTPTITYSDIEGGWSGTGNINADPLLGSLADNGGSVQSRALAYNSPAIDAGDPATCLSTDQRGQARDDLGCDMGAYELKYADNHAASLAPSSSAITTYGPALAGVQYNSGFTNPGVITITRSTSWATQGPESIQSWWIITPTVSSGISTTLELCYTDAESNSLSLANLRFWSYHDDAWGQVGGVPTTSTDINGNHCAQISGVDSFSTWTLATSAPTAVQLNRFSVATTQKNWAWAFALPGVMGIAGLALVKRKRR